MSLKQKIQHILDFNRNDSIIYELIKNQLKHFKRDEKRLVYDLQSNYDDVITNRNKLAKSIAIKGLSEKSIYRKIYGYETTGFNPKNEFENLTKNICLALKCKREDVVKRFNT